VARCHLIRLFTTRQDAIFVQHLGRNLDFVALARDPLAKYLGRVVELGGVSRSSSSMTPLHHLESDVALEPNYVSLIRAM
jgi:hypothetical protein